MRGAARWMWWAVVPSMLLSERREMPDLLVTRISVSDAGRFRLVEPTVGSAIHVEVEIENRSSTGAPDVSVVCRRQLSATGPHQAQATVRSGVLAPNAKTTVSLSIPASAGAGTEYMWCVVDGGNFVPESNEQNNILTQSFTIHANDPNAFAIELRNFQPWVEETHGHRRVTVDVVNVSNRGALTPPPRGINHRARWQAVCSVPAMPWVRVRTSGDMRIYPGGDLPAPGQSRRVSFWLFPVDLYPHPPASTFGPTLQLACKLTTGAFLPNMPVVHQGVQTVEADWMPAPAWWSRSFVFTIPNPDSKTYKPPQDVAITSLTVSGSQTADTPPLEGQHNFARIAFKLQDPVARLDVACSADPSSSGALNRTGVVYNAGTSATAVINLGLLPAGKTFVRCVADPYRKISEADTLNNSRLITATVYPPGPDLAVTAIHPRDGGRYSLVTPTAGSKMRVHVEVTNRTGGSAPDNVLTCTHSTMRGGPILDKASIQTGAIGGGQKKTLGLDLTPGAAGPGSVTCTVDASQAIAEANESDNTLADDFAIHADLPTMFEVDLTNFQTWYTSGTGHRVLRATIVNKGRGPASPALGSTSHALRWQAACQIPQMPWVEVRTEGDMRKYAGGALPAPGQSVSASFWLFPVSLSGMPEPETLPKTVDLHCTLTVGAFMPNAPVVHLGDKLPNPDWMPAPKYWSKFVVYKINNPESRLP